MSMLQKTALECINEGDPEDPCRGDVTMTTTDGLKFWARCEHHFDERMKKQAHIDELTSPCPAPWFDPEYAGETWGDPDDDIY